eukprot:scaffold132246_cov78-Phaeocystis_antarctica.AAC.1
MKALTGSPTSTTKRLTTASACGEGEKVRGECVVAAANEALGAREHCRCAQVDLHRGDGGPLGSVMRKAS